MADRAKITAILSKYAGTPYLYGGQSMKGVDCSGLMMCLFYELGFTIPDMSAAAARQYFKGYEISPELAEPGDLYFYGDPIIQSIITHVTICFKIWPGGNRLIIGANSGASDIINDRIAYTRAAFVKIDRACYWQKNLKCVINPFKKLEV